MTITPLTPPLTSNKQVMPTNMGKLSLNNATIEFVDSHIYLRVTVDKDLTFCAHVNQVLKPCSHKLFTLSKIKKNYR